MPTVTLAVATPADLPLLATYMRGLRTDDPMPVGTLADDSTAAGAMAALISTPSLGAAWLIHTDGKPVGYAVVTFVHSIEFGGRCGFIDELYIEPAARSKGIGRQAIDLVAAEAAAAGVQILLLEVSPENEQAARLYERAGFDRRKYRLMTRRLH